MVKKKKAVKNNRKNVLIASIVLALMIVAGSSFAWFISSDEVVNKLTANSEYNVVAVENFTPPPNWIPGRTVTKEVRTTNTGNIDAFVKATFSNTLSFTAYDYSEKYTPEHEKKYIELSEEEVKSLQKNRIVVWGNNISDETDGNSFVPKETGLYIFDRSGTSNRYSGYYFVSSGSGGKYYKLDTIENKDSNFTATLKTKTDILTVNPQLQLSDDGKKIIAIYTPKENEKGNEIIINITLAENYNNNWTYNEEKDINDELSPTFYYNRILNAGTTSELLTTSVQLDKSVKNDRFIDMDYNLKITVDSAQVTDTDDKTEAINSQYWAKLEAVMNGNIIEWKSKTNN